MHKRKVLWMKKRLSKNRCLRKALFDYVSTDDYTDGKFANISELLRELFFAERALEANIKAQEKDRGGRNYD